MLRLRHDPREDGAAAAEHGREKSPAASSRPQARNGASAGVAGRSSTEVSTGRVKHNDPAGTCALVKCRS